MTTIMVKMSEIEQYTCCAITLVNIGQSERTLLDALLSLCGQQ